MVQSKAENALCNCAPSNFVPAFEPEKISMRVEGQDHFNLNTPEKHRTLNGATNTFRFIPQVNLGRERYLVVDSCQIQARRIVLQREET